MKITLQENIIPLDIAGLHFEMDADDITLHQTISDFMEEHRVQKHKDNTVVNKVNRLKDAIEELSDGDDMDFSVAELSAYLDMSVEEIEDILRIAGEEP